MYNPNNDGIYHINIYSGGKTELGRLLSNFAHTPTVIDGEEFASIEGYWYWLKSGRKDEKIKRKYGVDAKVYGKSLGSVFDENFCELVLEGIRCKLRQHKNIRDLLKDSTLPFAHYYCFGEGSTTVIKDIGKRYHWILEEFERLRGLLRGEEIPKSEGRAVVINKHRAVCDVDIARGSPFGNPWSYLDSISPEYRVRDREEAISKFREYFNNKIAASEDFRRMVLNLRGKRLGCTCKPKACHGDVITEWLRCN